MAREVPSTIVISNKTQIGLSFIVLKESRDSGLAQKSLFVALIHTWLKPGDEH